MKVQLHAVSVHFQRYLKRIEFHNSRDEKIEQLGIFSKKSCFSLQCKSVNFHAGNFPHPRLLSAKYDTPVVVSGMRQSVVLCYVVTEELGFFAACLQSKV